MSLSYISSLLSKLQSSYSALNSSKAKYTVYIIIYTFLFVYFPPLLSINLLHVLTIYSFIILVVFYRTKYQLLVIKTLLINVGIPFVIAIFCLLCVVLIKGSSIMAVYPYILMITEIPVCVIYLISFFKRHKYQNNDVINVLIIVGFVQGIIAVLCFLIPQVKEILINMYIRNQFSAQSSKNIFLIISKTRINGLSSSLTFMTPVIQSILGLISLYLGLNKSYKYMVYVPIMLASAFINARSSFIVIIYGVILILLMSEKNKKTVQRLLWTAFMALILVPLLFFIIGKSNVSTLKWISDGLYELIKFTQGERIGYFEMTRNFIRFPKGLSLVFGTGKDIFAIGGGMDSDIGYVNDIWRGGLIFLSLAYYTFISYYIKVYRYNDRIIKFIATLFICTFFIINIKGSVVSNNEFINVSILLCTVFVLNKNDESIED